MSFLTTSVSVDSNSVATLTVSASDASVQPAPTSASVTVGVTTLTLALDASSGTPTGAVQFAVFGLGGLFPTIARILAQVSASGYDSSSVALFNPTGHDGLPCQALARTGQPYLIGPTTKAQVRTWLFGFAPETAGPEASLAELLHEAWLCSSLLLQLLVATVLPALTTSPPATVTLTADEQHALTDLTTSVLPQLDLVLGTIYPASGPRTPLYQALVDKVPSQKQALDVYAQTLAQFPNLT